MSSSSENTASLPYHEPGIVTILIISSFLLLLNAVNYILDRIVYCGLVGQLFIGIGWGMPGANWLSAELQDSIVQLGYIGLILIVYEGKKKNPHKETSDPQLTIPPGGISSNLKALKANLFLSSAVALTGIAAPIGLSFVLLGLLPLSPVQAFAAGAALCSTSLGTTFTVLATSGLTESRLGVVLSSAAMMDDVVGLVMVQIIPTLGAGSSFTEITVIRPVFVSIAFAVLIPLICLFVAKPVMQKACGYLKRPENAKYKAVFWSPKAALVYQTAVLLAMVTGSTYAGTSNLFAAYLAGAAVTWLGDSVTINEVEQPSSTGATTSQDSSQSPRRSQSNSAPAPTHEPSTPCSGRAIYEHYYSPAVESLLRPLFFASIGFAIPITKMFSGRVVWRGLVYTILMIFAKLICGLWLVRFAPMPRAKAISKLLQSIKFSGKASSATGEKSPQQPDSTSATSLQRPQNVAVTRRQSSSISPTVDNSNVDATAPTAPPNDANTSRKRIPHLPRPKSLYPAAILGSAMVSRGEIGFLISSVAESNGVFGEGGNSEEYLVVTWAILLCTLIGPVTVGLLVKRVKRLQAAERRKANGLEDPLGIWGVLPSSGGNVRA
jgi:Kef-type K+ transport system membrane component KefB